MEQLMGEKKEKKTRYTNGTTQEWKKKTRYLWNTRLGAPNRFMDNICFNKTYEYGDISNYIFL
jgi:hypothetical protein